MVDFAMIKASLTGVWRRLPNLATCVVGRRMDTQRLAVRSRGMMVR
jgi:hypothetical protein